MSSGAVINQQPPAFRLAFLTSLFERFGFYALNFVLVLYAKAQFNFPDTYAFILYGVFNGLAYLTPILGGYLADNYFGIRRSMIFGLILEAIGLLLCAIPNQEVFIFSLALIVIGVGFFKTSPTNLLGRSYKHRDPKIDRGFTLYYTGMNIGSLGAALAIGFLRRDFGWGIAFIVAGCMLILALLSYIKLRKKIGDADSLPGYRKLSFKTWFTIMVVSLAALLVCDFLIDRDFMADIFFFLFTVVVIGYFGFEILRSPREDKWRIIACWVLIFIGFSYFVLWNQGLTSVELFIARAVGRKIGSFEIPTVMFLGLNSLWVIAFGPLLAGLYKVLIRKRGRDLIITTKFTLGLLAMSMAFLWLVISIHLHTSDYLVSPYWMIGAFAWFALGEMLIGALGVAMVTHIAPKHMYGVTMGAWFLSTAVASPVAGWLASITDATGLQNNHPLLLHVYGSGFLKMAIIGAFCALLAFMTAPFVRRIAGLDQKV